MPRVFALALALVGALAAVARADSPVPAYPRAEPHIAISNGLDRRELDDLVKWMRRKLLRADADYHVLLVEFTHPGNLDERHLASAEPYAKKVLRQWQKSLADDGYFLVVVSTRNRNVHVEVGPRWTRSGLAADDIARIQKKIDFAADFQKGDYSQGIQEILVRYDRELVLLARKARNKTLELRKEKVEKAVAARVARRESLVEARRLLPVLEQEVGTTTTGYAYGAIIEARKLIAADDPRSLALIVSARLLLSQAHDRKKATLAKARELAPDGGSDELRAAVSSLEKTDGDPGLMGKKSEELEALLRPLVGARDARDRADMTARVQVLADEVARLEKARTELARTAPRSLGPDVDRLGRMLEQSARSLRSIEREDAAVRETSFAASKNQIAIHARELAALEERAAAHAARIGARIEEQKARLGRLRARIRTETRRAIAFDALVTEPGRGVRIVGEGSSNGDARYLKTIYGKAVTSAAEVLAATNHRKPLESVDVEFTGGSAFFQLRESAPHRAEGAAAILEARLAAAAKDRKRAEDVLSEIDSALVQLEQVVAETDNEARWLETGRAQARKVLEQLRACTPALEADPNAPRARPVHASWQHEAEERQAALEKLLAEIDPRVLVFETSAVEEFVASRPRAEKLLVDLEREKERLAAVAARIAKLPREVGAPLDRAREDLRLDLDATSAGTIFAATEARLASVQQRRAALEAKVAQVEQELAAASLFRTQVGGAIACLLVLVVGIRLLLVRRARARTLA